MRMHKKGCLVSRPYSYSVLTSMLHTKREGALGWTGLCKEIVHIKTPRNKTSTNLGPLVLSRLPPCPRGYLIYICMHALNSNILCGLVNKSLVVTDIATCIYLYVYNMYY